MISVQIRCNVNITGQGNCTIHISLRSSIERAMCAVYSRFACGEQWQIPNRISCVLQPAATSHEEARGDGKRRIALAEVGVTTSVRPNVKGGSL